MSNKVQSSFAVPAFFKCLGQCFEGEISEEDELGAVERALNALSHEEREVALSMLRKDKDLLDVFLTLLGDEGMHEALHPLYADLRVQRLEGDLIDDWLDESFEELWSHQADHGRSDEATIDVVSMFSGNNDMGVELRISVFDPNPMINSVVWDKKMFRTNDPVLDAFFCCDHPAFVNYKAEQIKPWAPHPLFRYHPERFRQTRRYVGRVPKMLQANGLSDNANSEQGIQLLCGEIISDLNHYGLKEPLRDKLKSPTPPAASIHDEFSMYVLHREFSKSGKQIFDLTGPLVEMFKNTSVDDIPVDLLSSPYPSYYIHFGEQSDLEFKAGWFVDGAYVQHIPESRLIQFIFTSIPSDHIKVKHWTLHKEPSFVLAIGEDDYAGKLGRAVEHVLAAKRRALLEKIGKGDQDRTEELTKHFEKEKIDPPQIRVKENAETVGKMELEAFERQLPVMQKALELAVNAMCYLTAYPDDINLEWPSNTPKSLLAKAAKGHPNIKKNSLSKLESLGYHKVRICGRALFQGPVTQAIDGERTVRTHWRRGHWRPQAYGKGRALRKAVLIKPVMVNSGGALNDDVPGTIYIGTNIVDLKVAKKKRDS